MVECRREILESLPQEPERIWTSNFTRSLRCIIWTMLPVAVRSTSVTKTRTGLRCTMKALAKGCRKLWVVTVSYQKRWKKTSCPSLTSCHWALNFFGEAPLSQWNLYDENKPMQEDDEATLGWGRSYRGRRHLTWAGGGRSISIGGKGRKES